MLTNILERERPTAKVRPLPLKTKTKPKSKVQTQVVQLVPQPPPSKAKAKSSNTGCWAGPLPRPCPLLQSVLLPCCCALFLRIGHKCLRFNLFHFWWVGWEDGGAKSSGLTLVVGGIRCKQQYGAIIKQIWKKTEEREIWLCSKWFVTDSPQFELSISPETEFWT